jgi:hypothetical protein
MMTVGELIDGLKDKPKDMLVTVYADHGQVSFKATCLTPIKLEQSQMAEWMMESTHEDDLLKYGDYVDAIEVS